MYQARALITSANKIASTILFLLFMYIAVSTVLCVFLVPVNAATYPVYSACAWLIPVVATIGQDDFSVFCGYGLFVLFALVCILVLNSAIKRILSVLEPAVALGIDFLTPASLTISQAKAMAKSGNYAGAIRNYQAVLRKNHGYPGAHYSLGYCYTMIQDYAAAIDAFHEEIQIGPGEAINARIGAGFCYIQLKWADEAVQELEEAVRIKPDSAAAFNQLAIAYQLSGRLADASRAYEQMKKLHEPGGSGAKSAEFPGDKKQETAEHHRANL